MPQPVASFLFQPGFSLYKSYFGAKMCQLSYANTAGDKDLLKIAMGATSYSVIGQVGLAPPIVVWDFGANGKACSFAGINSTRQFLVYLGLSMANEGSTHFGRASAFVRYCYGLQKTALMETLGGTGARTPRLPLYVAGHSAGAAVAQLMCCDVLKNYDTAFDIKSCHLFGSPKCGDNAFQAPISSQITGSNYRNAFDPISTHPSRGSGIFSTIVNGFIGGQQIYAMFNDFRDLQLCYHLSPQRNISFRQEPNHGETGDREIMDLIMSFIESNELPASHSINNYVKKLYNLGFKEATEAGLDNVLTLMRGTDAIHGDVPDTQADIDGASLPSINSFRSPEGLPGGATQNRSGGVIHMHGSAQYVGTDARGRRKPRAKRGDGHTRQRIREIYSRMQRVIAHDIQTTHGLTRGSPQYFHFTACDEEEMEAFIMTIKALRRVINNWNYYLV